MSLLVQDKWLERRLIAQRRAWGVDGHDEVWEGIYVMSPLADNVHQELVAGITTALQIAIGWEGLGKVFPGVNVTDRVPKWKKNYRAPDVVVILHGSAAVSHGTFWTGPLDFVVEILSRGDRSRKKLPFYSKIGVREVLLVDRNPWRLSLYRHDGESLKVVGQQEIGGPAVASEVIPIRFELLLGDQRPTLQLAHATDGRTWLT
jgi:Uma2 family endonuclease